MSDSWVCPGGLPDVHDRQRAFYPSVEEKMSYMSVRVSLSMGYLMDRLYVCQYFDLIKTIKSDILI